MTWGYDKRDMQIPPPTSPHTYMSYDKLAEPKVLGGTVHNRYTLQVWSDALSEKELDELATKGFRAFTEAVKEARDPAKAKVSMAMSGPMPEGMNAPVMFMTEEKAD